jgi:hypothetical protein
MIELMLAKEPENRGHLAMPGNTLDPASGSQLLLPLQILSIRISENFDQVPGITALAYTKMSYCCIKSRDVPDIRSDNPGYSGCFYLTC